jgi:hypothetical protein
VIDRRGSGAFHWNAGGWFGSQLGGTLWLFVSGAVLLGERPRSGLVLLGCGLGANLLGLLLWASRRRLRAYRGLQLLVSVVCGSGLLATAWLDRSGELALLDPRVGAGTMVLLLLGLWAGLLVLFAARERSARLS